MDAFDLYMDRANGMNSANTMGQNLASYFFLDNITNIYKVFGKLGKKIANGLLGISACSTSIKNVKDSNAQWKNKQKQNTYHKSHPFEPYYPNQAVMY